MVLWYQNNKKGWFPLKILAAVIYILKLIQVIIRVQHLWLVEGAILMTGLLTCSSDKFVLWIIAQGISSICSMCIFLMIVYRNNYFLNKVSDIF